LSLIALIFNAHRMRTSDDRGQMTDIESDIDQLARMFEMRRIAFL